MVHYNLVAPGTFYPSSSGYLFQEAPCVPALLATLSFC